MQSLWVFRHWDVIALFIAMAIVFGLEMLGVFSDKYVTITYVFSTFIPKWALAMAWGWLGYHFLFGQ